MKIKKEVKSKFKKNYFLSEGFLDINSKHFMKEIDSGVEANNNANYKTNVIGKMTEPNYFVNNSEFIKVILPLLDYIDNTFKDAPQYNLNNAWGYKEGFGEYTREHHHINSWLSGVIYLNKHHQNLIFPEINHEISPEEGKFILFSPFLLHKTRRNITKKIKYGMAFNFHCTQIFDTL